MSLGTLNSGFAPVSVGSVTISVTLTNPTDSSTTLLATIGDPSSGTLQTWDLYYREVGAESWIEYATGLTEATQNIGDLDASKSYEAYAVGHVLVDVTTSTSSADTAEAPPIPAATSSLWLGTGLSTVNNPLADTYSYRATITNTSSETWTSVALLFHDTNATPGQIIGFRVQRNGGTWTLGTIKGQAPYTPPAGSWDSANRWFGLSDFADLAVSVAPGESLVVETVEAAGNHSAGLFSVSAYPTIVTQSSRSAAGQNSMTGSATWTSGYSQPWTHLLIKTAGSGIRKVATFGDSLVDQVVPLADSPNTRRQGYVKVANDQFASATEKANVVAFGQGGATITTVKTFAANLIPEIAAHLDVVLGQGWTYNQSPTDQPGLDNLISDTQSILTTATDNSLRTGAIIMSPPGSSRNTAPYLFGYDGAYAYWAAQVPTRFVDLAPSVVDGVDPTIINPTYSQDGIHINSAGSSVHGTAYHDQIMTMLTATGEI